MLANTTSIGGKYYEYFRQKNNCAGNSRNNDFCSCGAWSCAITPELTLQQQADAIGAQVYYWQNGGNPTVGELEAALKQVAYLQGRVAELEGENEALIKQLAELQRELANMKNGQQLGNQIPFKLIAITIFARGTDLSAIVRSVEELNAVLDGAGNEWLLTSAHSYRWNQFDDDFFATRALLLHFGTRPSVSVSYSLENVTVDDDKVVLQIVGQFSGGKALLAITFISLVIEVNQSDIESVVNLERTLRGEYLGRWSEKEKMS